MTTTIQAKAIILEHFPAFEYKKVYNEERMTGGHIIKFWGARGYDTSSAAYKRMMQVLGGTGVLSICNMPNNRGGHDLILSV